MLVKLASEGMKWEAFNLSKELRNSGKIPSDVYAVPDKTRLQRQHEYKLREELRNRKKRGESNLQIRKGKIVPLN